MQSVSKCVYVTVCEGKREPRKPAAMGSFEVLIYTDLTYGAKIVFWYLHLCQPVGNAEM